MGFPQLLQAQDGQSMGLSPQTLVKERLCASDLRLSVLYRRFSQPDEVAGIWDDRHRPRLHVKDTFRQPICS